MHFEPLYLEFAESLAALAAAVVILTVILAALAA